MIDDYESKKEPQKKKVKADSAKDNSKLDSSVKDNSKLDSSVKIKSEIEDDKSLDCQDKSIEDGQGKSIIDDQGKSTVDDQGKSVLCFTLFFLKNQEFKNCHVLLLTRLQSIWMFLFSNSHLFA